MNDLKLAGLTVLVLEDEYILADDARRVLVRAGAEVIGPFVTAGEALEATETDRPDCALLDLDLGGGADFEPARILQRRGVPLVFFSGYDVSVVPADLRRERFIEKPVFMAAIVDVIASACGRPATLSKGGAAPAPGGHAWRTQSQLSL